MLLRTCALLLRTPLDPFQAHAIPPPDHPYQEQPPPHLLPLLPPSLQVVGLGVLGKEGSGRLRVVASQQKQKLSAKAQKKFKARAYGSSGSTSGLSSSLAFTPVQVGGLTCSQCNITGYRVWWGERRCVVVGVSEGGEQAKGQAQGSRPVLAPSLRGKPKNSLVGGEGCTVLFEFSLVHALAWVMGYAARVVPMACWALPVLYASMSGHGLSAARRPCSAAPPCGRRVSSWRTRLRASARSWTRRTARSPTSRRSGDSGAL